MTSASSAYPPSMSGPLPPRKGARAGDASSVEDEAVPLYKLAFAEAQRSLDDQRDELNQARQRAVQFLAFVGTATAFLVGTGLRAAADRPAAFYIIAVIGTALAFAGLLAMLYLLIPVEPVKGEDGSRNLHRMKWEYRLSGSALIGWTSAEVGRPTEREYLEALVSEYDEMMQGNERLLSKLRFSYIALISVGLLQLVLWTTLVWLFG